MAALTIHRSRRWDASAGETVSSTHHSAPEEHVPARQSGLKSIGGKMMRQSLPNINRIRLDNGLRIGSAGQSQREPHARQRQ